MRNYKCFEYYIRLIVLFMQILKRIYSYMNLVGYIYIYKHVLNKKCSFFKTGFQYYNSKSVTYLKVISVLHASHIASISCRVDIKNWKKAG